MSSLKKLIFFRHSIDLLEILYYFCTLLHIKGYIESVAF